MKHLSTSRARVGLALLLAFMVVRCSSDAVQFTPEQDDEVIGAIERAWSGNVGKGPISISFCEDRAANDADVVDSCQVSHVVKGGGRTVAHEVEQPGGVGCGGCPFMVRTRVKAVVKLPTGDAQLLQGIVAFGSVYDSDPYAGDWAFQLESEEGSATPLTFEGRIQDDGTMLLWGQLVHEADLSDGTDDVTLGTSAPATCVRDL